MGAPQVCAVVLSGGSGQRFGNPAGKQLIEVAGRPLMSWCLDAFDKAASVDCIVVVCPVDSREEVEARAVAPFAFSTPVLFAGAGPTRQASTDSGLACVPKACDYVAIHDGARPLVAAAQIDEAVEQLLGDPALAGLVFGQPSVDTLKVVDDDGNIVSTPDRGRFWTVQTPQIFKKDVLLRAQRAAQAEGFVGTDDASIVERLGERVACFAAPRDNLKLTVPEDLPLVEALLRGRSA